MKRTLLLVGLAATALLAYAVFWLGRDAPPIRAAALSVAEAMASDTVGYARAQAVRAFVFPEDHGPHPDFKTEWWYYTGNLESAEGRRFGYEFTIFRFALAPPEPRSDARGSGWASRQLYMGHFGFTDVASEEFFAFERLSRGAAGLAGAQATPFRVWVEDWETRQAPGGMPAMHLAVEQDGVGIDLRLRPTKPFVFQGDRGLDQKGAELGNASYYYSMTRLATEGTVTVGGATFAVEGSSWMDREWSTSALGPDQVGWDWFALQLDDGREVMYYQLRETGGRISPESDGVLVAADGSTQALGRDDVALEVLGRWRSPKSGATYPSGWRLQIPAQALDLRVTPVIPNQEMDVAVRYWEGAVAIEGTAGGQPVQGQGYVELTGYDAVAPGAEGRGGVSYEAPGAEPAERRP